MEPMNQSPNVRIDRRLGSVGRVALAWLLLWALPRSGQAACSVTQGDFDGNGRDDVRIVGDARHQYISIADSQASYRVQVDCNGDGDFTDAEDVDTGVRNFDIETFDVQGKGQDKGRRTRPHGGIR